MIRRREVCLVVALLLTLSPLHFFSEGLPYYSEYVPLSLGLYGHRVKRQDYISNQRETPTNEYLPPFVQNLPALQPQIGAIDSGIFNDFISPPDSNLSPGDWFQESADFYRPEQEDIVTILDDNVAAGFPGSPNGPSNTYLPPEPYAGSPLSFSEQLPAVDEARDSLGTENVGNIAPRGSGGLNADDKPEDQNDQIIISDGDGSESADKSSVGQATATESNDSASSKDAGKQDGGGKGPGKPGGGGKGPGKPGGGGGGCKGSGKPSGKPNGGGGGGKGPGKPSGKPSGGGGGKGPGKPSGDCEETTTENTSSADSTGNTSEIPEESTTESTDSTGSEGSANSSGDHGEPTTVSTDSASSESSGNTSEDHEESATDSDSSKGPGKPSGKPSGEGGGKGSGKPSGKPGAGGGGKGPGKPPGKPGAGGGGCKGSGKPGNGGGGKGGKAKPSCEESTTISNDSAGSEDPENISGVYEEPTTESSSVSSDPLLPVQ